MGSSVELFPVNGLDRSLHAPVLLGLLVSAFFAETLGWTFAGLVVPGYLVSVIVAAPLTAVLVVVEALLTYFLCAAIGLWIPRTGAWSTAFGRERFFLFILAALAIRLSVEASLLPCLQERYELPHSRELHSLGLVLVPLLANMLWNDGLLRSFTRVSCVVAITYVLVSEVLLKHTNFNVSRFEMANESVSLDFLETPHAQIILVTGALVAARANVLYGWDYNGILVPALLAVAWYQPTKLLTTCGEALLIYMFARAIVRLPPWSRLLMVGTRRTLLTFVIGFALKWTLGVALAHVDPTVHMLDYQGFGYLLPTLLATKMWNRVSVGTVLVPTLQVSVVAFALGNLIGYVVTLPRHTEARTLSRGTSVQSTHPLSVELMLADTAPDPSLVRQSSYSSTRLALEIFRRIDRKKTVGGALLRRADRLSMTAVSVEGVSGRYLMVGPRSADPDADVAAPRAAVRLHPQHGCEWLLLVESGGDSEALVATADQLGTALGVRAIVLQRSGTRLGDFDAAFARSLASLLRVDHILRLRVDARDELSVVGELPRELDSTGLQEVLGLDGPLPRRWRMPGETADLLEEAPIVALQRSSAERAGLLALPKSSYDVWQGGLAAWVSQQQANFEEAAPVVPRAPTVEELRLLRGTVVSPGFVAGLAPSPWYCALATQLGLRFAALSALTDEGAEKSTGIRAVDCRDHSLREGPAYWALYEPHPGRRLGHPTWLWRKVQGKSDQQRLLIEVPAGGQESGTIRGGLMLFNGLQADSLLLSSSRRDWTPDGSFDARSRTGRQSLYQVIHQAWLERNGVAASIHAYEIRDREAVPGADVIVSLGRELETPDAAPSWAVSAIDYFRKEHMAVSVVDGSPELERFHGRSVPGLAFAQRFAPDSTVLLWLSPHFRERLKLVDDGGRHLARMDAFVREGRRPGPTRAEPVPALGGRVCRTLGQTSLCEKGAAPSESRVHLRSEMPALGPKSSERVSRSVFEVVHLWASCTTGSAERWCFQAVAGRSCDPRAIGRQLQLYTASRNPYRLQAALGAARGCMVLSVHDPLTDVVWAAVADSGEMVLVPLSTGQVERSEEVGSDPLEELAPTLASGLAAWTVVRQPDDPQRPQ
ncbi:MAG: poly-gamma-glutamate biosynthesis protein PgsC/CapC [Myxococcales bacterium]|nr:poly-gamma-glutamate biosynthesis protein PgsC/CapC [Myxococcales bacterium]